MIFAEEEDFRRAIGMEEEGIALAEGEVDWGEGKIAVDSLEGHPLGVVRTAAEGEGRIAVAEDRQDRMGSSGQEVGNKPPLQHSLVVVDQTL